MSLLLLLTWGCEQRDENKEGATAGVANDILAAVVDQNDNTNSNTVSDAANHSAKAQSSASYAPNSTEDTSGLFSYGASVSQIGFLISTSSILSGTCFEYTGSDLTVDNRITAPSNTNGTTGNP